MPVRKLSIALDEEIAKAAAKSAKREGLTLSAWLSRAAADRLRVQMGLAAVAEYERQHGAFTEEEERAMDAELDAATHRRKIELGLATVGELEKEHGAFTEEERRAADTV